MNMQRKPGLRLLLADDHRLLVDARRSLLEPEYQVVGVETDGRSLVKSALVLKPDVVILDIAMPHLNGLDAAQQIKQKVPSTKLVFMTMNQAPEVAAEAFRRGASAYVLKQSAAEELVKCRADGITRGIVSVVPGCTRNSEFPAESGQAGDG